MDVIRKIIIGQNPKDAMAYYVGMRIGDSKVVVIEFNERGYYKTSERSYKIYLEHPKDGTMFWKEIVNMPCIVEYDLNF
jgi:hypothetical protein